MNIPVASFIYQVKVCIDEIGLDDAEFVDSQDNEEMDKIIASKILDALRFVNGNADLSMLGPDTVIDSATAETGTITAVSNGTLYRYDVTLPDNFLRLVSAKLASWKRKVGEAMEMTDPAYAKMSYPQTTGTPERPYAAMDRNDHLLQLFSGLANNESVKVDIITEPAIQEDDDNVEYITVSDKLKEALIYYAAGLTLLTYRDQHADAMFNIAMTYMGIDTNGQNPDRQ